MATALQTIWRLSHYSAGEGTSFELDPVMLCVISERYTSDQLVAAVNELTDLHEQHGNDFGHAAFVGDKVDLLINGDGIGCQVWRYIICTFDYETGLNLDPCNHWEMYKPAYDAVQRALVDHPELHDTYQTG